MPRSSDPGKANRDLPPISRIYCQRFPETNWIVITGAPCSGKTSIIRELERLGHRVVHEAARELIDGELKKGKALAEIRSDAAAFEKRVLSEKCVRESRLPPRARIFFDRGIPDSIAYFKAAGLDTSEPVQKSGHRRYKKIFFLDRLVFERDAVRAENDVQAAALEDLIQESYRMLGYAIERVPLLSVTERTAFVLNRL